MPGVDTAGAVGACTLGSVRGCWVTSVPAVCIAVSAPGTVTAWTGSLSIHGRAMALG